MHPPVTPFESQPMKQVRVLAITPTPTHPTTAGNRARYRALLERLQDRGGLVRLLHVNHEPGDPDAMREAWHGGFRQVPFAYPVPRHQRWNRFAARCRKYLMLPLAPRVDVDDWFDPRLSSEIAAEVAEFQPDVIVMMYLWFSAGLESLPPGTLRVLDAQDVFTDRNARMRAAGIDQVWFSVPAHEEARGLDRFDVILAIQEHERAHYRSLSQVPVVTVGHFLPIIESGPVPSEATLLIIGSDNDVNVHGVTWFLAEVWPEVRSRRPDAILRLVGRICEKIAPTAGVELCGVVDDLTEPYRRAAMVINPLQGGTGLKIKGAEALGAGRVVISTPSAALGLEGAIDAGMIVCESAAEMQRAIVTLLDDPVQLQALSRAAQQFARDWNEGYQRQFDEVFAPSLRPDHLARNPVSASMANESPTSGHP